MWPALTAEIADRVLRARSFFSSIAGDRATPAALPATQQEITARGLIFVRLYAVYEFTVRDVVRAAITELKGRGTPFGTLRLELLALALHHHLQTVADCKDERRWQERVAMFRRVDAHDPLDVDDHTFPNNGTQYRIGQLYTIWEVFGISHTITPVIPNPRHTSVIGELVENGNAIAHGRRTPEDVGGRYARDDIHDRIDAVSAICSHVLGALHAHCSNPANLSR